MEEEKAAAYYDELSRKGEGAARFKQGLGFSERGSASSSSFLNPKSTATNGIGSIIDKLKKKKDEDRVTENQANEHHCRESRERRRSRRDDRDRGYRRRSRSLERRREEVKEKKIDYSRLIKGYDHMSAAEKVKARMKLQLDETAAKDTSKGAGWERFEFDKDAPVDDDEVEGTDDDDALVKRIGHSFRFSAVEAIREEQLKAAHDEAMYGVPTRHIHTGNTDNDVGETTNVKDDEKDKISGTKNLVSEKVLAKQQGSWRDRARKP